MSDLSLNSSLPWNMCENSLPFNDVCFPTDSSFTLHIGSNIYPFCHYNPSYFSPVRMFNAFEEQIGSAVENAITKQLKEGSLKLDSFLQALPKEIPLDDAASLNVTLVNDPLLSNSSIGFEINGLFTPRDPVPKFYDRDSQPLVSCGNSSKMLGISLDEAVFNSMSALYFNVSL